MCQCKANRTRCCQQCAFCLSKLWEPCCDCVGEMTCPLDGEGRGGPNATAPACQSIYFNDCLSMSRCRAACQSVGAWRYRWFHSACCQCLGPDCQGYGGAHANCSNCQD
ncbi:Twisted gastrulation protein-like 1 [Ophiophagus hannah]|uniref:Twisted gastrulation protein-like 1 n=1 Tax=Ophiophagus hannah TaxID=8665 RepID=V8NT03_OPHHA|nr:Twisted gastrulation protein-like 1 [Ophiophagus hannah]